MQISWFLLKGPDTCTNCRICRIATYFWFQEKSYLALSKYLLHANHSQGNTLRTGKTRKEEAQDPREVCQLKKEPRVRRRASVLREQAWAAMELPWACQQHPWKRKQDVKEAEKPPRTGHCTNPSSDDGFEPKHKGGVGFRITGVRRARVKENRAI